MGRKQHTMTTATLPLGKRRPITGGEPLATSYTQLFGFFGYSGAGGREDNQDSIRHTPADDSTIPEHGAIFAVADGMGGYEHGAIASALALQTFFDSFYGAPDGNTASIAQRMRASAERANVAVYQTAQRLQARMGTTLTAMHMQDDVLTIAHIGDSRAYLVRDGAARCLTDDHTGVGEMVRAGLIAPNKVRTHQQRSLLTRAIGLQPTTEPDLHKMVIRAGDTLILASDGLWSVVEDTEFATLSGQFPSPEALGEHLVALAMARETDDNISVMVIQVPFGKGEPGGSNRKALWQGLPFFRKRSAQDE